MAINIPWSDWKLMKSSLSGLMHEAVPADVLDKIRRVISAEASGAREAHDLRTRHAGSATVIDFHLAVGGQTSVKEAHDICDLIEHALKAKVKDAVVTIHIEPENKAKCSGVLVL